MDLVHRVPCVVCRNLGWAQDGRTEAHHPRAGVGMSGRQSHFLVAALCAEHHRGATGVHGRGTRGFEALHRLTELDCVALTVEAVYRLLARG